MNCESIILLSLFSLVEFQSERKCVMYSYHKSQSKCLYHNKSNDMLKCTKISSSCANQADDGFCESFYCQNCCASYKHRKYKKWPLKEKTSIDQENMQ